MAKCAVTQLEGAKRLLKSLMLASLTSVVLLGQNTLTRGNARREVTAALSAIDVILGDEGLAAGLGALEFLLLLVRWWMSAKKLECQVFILVSLFLRQLFESLELDECFRAVFPAAVE